MATAELQYERPGGGYATDYIRDAATCERKLKNLCKRHIWADLVGVIDGERMRCGGVEIDGEDRWGWWFDPDAFKCEVQP